jgi:hypothetical protein
LMRDIALRTIAAVGALGESKGAVRAHSKRA